MEEKRTNNHRLGLATSARREKFMTLLCSSLYICSLSRTCIWAKFPQSHQECWLFLYCWPTRLLRPHILVVACPSCWLPCSVEFSVLLPSLDCRLPLTSVDCLVLSLARSLPWSLLLNLGPSFPRPLPGLREISRASPLCVFRAKTEKGIFWLAFTHTHTTNAQYRVTSLENGKIRTS